jgi:MFS family permease
VLARSAVTWVGYSVLCTWAWFLYSFGAILPLLRAEQGTSRTVMGLHSLSLSLGAVVAGLLTLAIVRRVRRRGAVRLGVLLMVAGIVGLCLAGSPQLTVPAVLVTGIGGSMMLNATLPGISDHHGDAASSVLSEGNALAAGVGIVAPLAIAGAVGLGVGWRPAAIVAIPLGVLTWWLLHRVPAGTPALDASPASRAAGPATPLGRRFWLLTTALMIGAGIEFANVAWAADLLHVRTGMSQGAAAIGVTAILVGMTAGRLAGSRLATRFAVRSLLLAALAVTAAGWLTTWLTTSPTVALTGLLLTGLGISGSYPLGVSLVYAAVAGQGDRASGIISLGIGSFAALTPFTLGALADATSTHTAFLVVPALVAIAAGVLVAAGRAPGTRRDDGRPDEPGVSADAAGR